MDENKNQDPVKIAPTYQTAPATQGIPATPTVPIPQNIPPIPSLNNLPVINNTWKKAIPIINVVFMVISLLFILAVDLPIAFKSPDLRPFLYEMLMVLAVFGVFFYLETFLYKNKLSNNQSSLDPYFVALIVVRNVFFVLNFIPLIQIIGMILLGLAGVPMVIAYIIMMVYRFKNV